MLITTMGEMYIINWVETLLQVHHPHFRPALRRVSMSRSLCGPSFSGQNLEIRLKREIGVYSLDLRGSSPGFIFASGVHIQSDQINICEHIVGSKLKGFLYSAAMPSSYLPV